MLFYTVEKPKRGKLERAKSPRKKKKITNIQKCKTLYNMRFVVKNTCSGNMRIGALTGFSKSPNTVIETPTLALLTQGGSVVHLTAEVLAKVFTKPQLLWLPLSNSIHLENGIKAQGQGVAKFAGLPDHIICATYNNFNEVTPSGHIEGKLVPLWTKQGKKMISADVYMDLMETFKPDIVLAVADSNLSYNEGQKRISKAVERTCYMLKKCVDRYKGSKALKDSSLIGVIVGAADEKNCQNCIQLIQENKDTLSGVALSGLAAGPNDCNSISNDEFDAVCMTVGSQIPKDMVHILEGCWNPAFILSAIEHGWDVFDGSFAVRLTDAGQALALNLNPYRHSDEMCILDLNDERYKSDFKPILEGCECLTCTKHKRSYVRHLLNTREMLASVLLSIHNLHHLNLFFSKARQHIASDTFSTYKSHILKQYEAYIPPCNGTVKEDVEVRKDRPVKKKRVSNIDIPNNNNNLVNGSRSLN